MTATPPPSAADEIRALLDGYDDDALIELPARTLRAALDERDALAADRTRQRGSAAFWRRRAYQLADLIPAEQIPDPDWGDDGQCDSRLHPDFADGADIRCQLPAGHAEHRNGERGWLP